ncbi:MAG: membrane-bound lytic murein transglycosylase MltF, partial [Gammaproteobacteria bacterium]
IKQDGTLGRLMDRYYGHLPEFNYVGTSSFLRHIRSRLPKYQELFMQGADAIGEDWRLVAAIGYQESHWNPKAVSPTGVRGIMMLTRNTTAYLGLNNRIDPRQSILGGARYFSLVKRKVPARISEPDRTWLALAAYNIGFGHLEDARKLTEGQGGNPDKWVDVKQRLPLLSQSKWYRHTEHGYARGQVSVQYVENVRSYYDILIWSTRRNHALLRELDSYDIETSSTW